MSIARITIMNFKEERDVKMSEEIYMTVQKDYFPNAELVVNVQTGEKSLLSLAIYPSYAETEKNISRRKLPTTPHKRYSRIGLELPI